MKDQEGNTTTYAYTGCGLLESVTDPRGYRTTILNEQLAICRDLGLSPAEIDAVFCDNIRRILGDAFD